LEGKTNDLLFIIITCLDREEIQLRIIFWDKYFLSYKKLKKASKIIFLEDTPLWKEDKYLKERLLELLLILKWCKHLKGVTVRAQYL
jgi:hypothetical protein